MIRKADILQPGALLYDVETNGLLLDLDRVHCMVIVDIAARTLATYGPPESGDPPVEAGLERLEKAPLLAHHNGIKFDNPAVQKVYGLDLSAKPNLDTLVWARLAYPDIKNTYGPDPRTGKPKSGDFAAWKAGRLPGGLIGAHGLEAYGYRMGVMKDEYQGDPAIEDPRERKARKWERWNPTMHSYMAQDGRVNLALLLKLLSMWPSEPTGDSNTSTNRLRAHPRGHHRSVRLGAPARRLRPGERSALFAGTRPAWAL